MRKFHKCHLVSPLCLLCVVFPTLDENWLNAVFYSLSPTGELLVIAHGSKFVLLTSRWNNDQANYTYTLKVELDNPNDIITSLICLPIVGTTNIQVRRWVN